MVGRGRGRRSDCGGVALVYRARYDATMRRRCILQGLSSISPLSLSLSLSSPHLLPLPRNECNPSKVPIIPPTSRSRLFIRSARYRPGRERQVRMPGKGRTAPAPVLHKPFWPPRGRRKWPDHAIEIAPDEPKWTPQSRVSQCDGTVITRFRLRSRMFFFVSSPIPQLCNRPDIWPDCSFRSKTQGTKYQEKIMLFWSRKLKASVANCPKAGQIDATVRPNGILCNSQCCMGEFMRSCPSRGQPLPVD